ncbi:MAG: hypothetical protein JSV54_01485 [Chloroflexota bacterium]|nr:MAG: hypothetical protein JSV54_01485 [Chloroflexota bacterium]
MEETDRLQKLVTIATDLTISGEIRTQAIVQLGKIGSHEALVALLDMVGNESLTWDERMRSLKQAERILKAGRQAWWYSLKPRNRS